MSTMRPHSLPTLVVAGLLAVCGGVARADAPPRRIVSFNLCADQLAVALADPAQIAGLTALARDPELSAVAAQARAFPTADQRSEAALALQPDLVLVGPHDRSAMRRTLALVGAPVHEVALVTDLDGARRQVRALAALFGHAPRGEALVAAIDVAERDLAAAAGGRTQTALLVERGGYVAGPASLAGAVLRAAGLVPPADAPGGLGGFVSLERLLVLKPDLLVLYEPAERVADQGMVLLTHPALAALYPPARRRLLPRRFALCGGPALVAALDYMRGHLLAAP
jgi:iron complex transport system substrate-binding protein